MWPDHLVTTYKRGSGSVNVYNFACASATTSRSIVAPNTGALDDGSPILTMEDQLTEFFNLGIGWTSINSLFFFTGTTTGNDIFNSASNYPSNTTLLPLLVQKWTNLTYQVCTVYRFSDSNWLIHPRAYGRGARNFVFLPVVPLELTPLGKTIWFVNNTVYYNALDYMSQYSAGLGLIASNLSATHPDATAFYFPQWRDVFYNVVDDPATYPSTAGILDVQFECKPNWVFRYGYDKR